jgi:hypothetical protein
MPNRGRRGNSPASSAPTLSRQSEHERAILAATSDIATAPRDGRVITVLTGPYQIVARACWHSELNGWVRNGDTQFAILPNVLRWLDGSKFLKPKNRVRK